VEVSDELFDRVEQLYAPPDDDVFQLVPPVFEEHVTQVYIDVGKPSVTDETFWDVYSRMQRRFQEYADEDAQDAFDVAFQMQHSQAFEREMELVPDQEPYNAGDNHDYADFTDNSSADDDWDGENEADTVEAADFTDEENEGDGEGVLGVKDMGSGDIEMADFSDFSSSST
jgi:hypothetical protein